MAAIAIPLRYAVGIHVNDEEGAYCCVITNYWKERQKFGRYQLPGLDRSLYDGIGIGSQSSAATRLNHSGQEVGLL